MNAQEPPRSPNFFEDTSAADQASPCGSQTPAGSAASLSGTFKDPDTLQEQITSLVKVAKPSQLRLLKALVLDLLSTEVVGQDSALVALVGLKNLGSLSAVVPTLPPPTPESLSLLLTSSSDKVQALNSALQLITSIKPNQVGLSCSFQRFILKFVSR